MLPHAGTPHARRASLQLLTAVVQEFSPATASPLGLPWDHHERCRASLEATYLQVSDPAFRSEIYIIAIGIEV